MSDTKELKLTIGTIPTLKFIEKQKLKWFSHLTIQMMDQQNNRSSSKRHDIRCSHQSLF